MHFISAYLVFHAGRSHYSELLAAGVRIYERGGGVLHSKTALIDGVWSCIGSTNGFSALPVAASAAMNLACRATPYAAS